jgi:hypothetical protein
LTARRGTTRGAVKYGFWTARRRAARRGQVWTARRASAELLSAERGALKTCRRSCWTRTTGSTTCRSATLTTSSTVAALWLLCPPPSGLCARGTRAVEGVGRGRGPRAWAEPPKAWAEGVVAAAGCCCWLLLGSAGPAGSVLGCSDARNLAPGARLVSRALEHETPEQCSRAVLEHETPEQCSAGYRHWRHVRAGRRLAERRLSALAPKIAARERGPSCLCARGTGAVRRRGPRAGAKSVGRAVRGRGPRAGGLGPRAERRAWLLLVAAAGCCWAVLDRAGCVRARMFGCSESAPRCSFGE